MPYSTRTAEPYTVLELKGDIDLSRSPDARRQILDCLEGGRHLLIDLGGVSYIDSSGVASLVEGYQTAKKKGLRFGLVGVSAAALGVLQLARLEKVFPLHASAEARIAADA